MKNFFIIAIVFFSVCGFLNFARADTKYNSFLDQNCNFVCALHEKSCLGITSDDNYYNSGYCFINEDLGGGDVCNNEVGDCNTVLNDDGFGGCTDASSTPVCFLHPARQAKWTMCICKDDMATTTPPTATTTINKLDIGKEYITDQNGNVSIVDKPNNLFDFIFKLIIITLGGVFLFLTFKK
jgi:hypothetical protein